MIIFPYTGMRECLQCGHVDYIGTGGLCINCIDDNKRDQAKLEELKKQGHVHHCAIRQVYGDGECECGEYKKGYKPYAWME